MSKTKTEPREPWEFSSHSLIWEASYLVSEIGTLRGRNVDIPTLVAVLVREQAGYLPDPVETKLLADDVDRVLQEYQDFEQIVPPPP